MSSPERHDAAEIEVDTSRELRCPECNKLLLKGRIRAPSAIEIPCPRCTKNARKFVKRRCQFL